MSLEQKVVAVTSKHQAVSTGTPTGRILYLMRGIPASGKSFKARELVRSYTQGLISEDTTTAVADVTSLRNRHTRIYSADDTFTGKNGKYKFDPSLLATSHQTCLNNVTTALSNPMIKCLVVDNTNTQLWEMKRYIEAA